MELVDAHIHFWDPERLRYDWLEGLAINRAFRPVDLAAQTDSFNLTGIVFVQAGAHPDDALAEVAWVSELAQEESRIRAIVADAPLELGSAVRHHLEALGDYPLVKGVRRLIQSEGAGFAKRPGFIEGVKLLPEFGYSFDICILHHQLGDVLTLVAACPEVRFVLDHLGKPGIKAGLIEPWRTEIGRLAQHANVSCKLSGLVTEADHEHWSAADLQPYVDHALACFGPERLMFGGDWPVALLAARDWAHWAETARASLPELEQQQLADIFVHNASRFYGFYKGTT